MPKIAPLLRRTMLQFCVAAALFLLLGASFVNAQNAGGLSGRPSVVHPVRALVGAKGEAHNGQFVMTEPRSTFYAPDDHEVIIYFEWEGPTGIHHCEGSVHGPDGESARSFVAGLRRDPAPASSGHYQFRQRDPDRLGHATESVERTPTFAQTHSRRAIARTGLNRAVTRISRYLD
jgi:hypothetical protein